MPRHHRTPNGRTHSRRQERVIKDIWSVINRVALLTPRSRLDYLAPINFALTSFRLGRGDLQMLTNLVDGLNIGAELCKRRICNDRAATIAAALQALVAVCDRAKTHGTWALLPDELEVLEEAVFIHVVQIDHCSCGELADATQAVIDMTRQAMNGQRRAGVTVVDPQTQGANASEAAALLAANS